MEILELLNKFLEFKKYPLEYDSNHKGNMLEFSFANPDISYEFMKQLNYEKRNNPLYAKLKTTLLLDGAKSEVKEKTREKKEKNEEDEISFNNLRTPSHSTHGRTNSKMLNYSKVNILSKSTNHQKITKPLGRDISPSSKIKINHEIINKFYENQNFVRISAPYATYEELRMKELRDDKKKTGFLNKDLPPTQKNFLNTLQIM